MPVEAHGTFFNQHAVTVVAIHREEVTFPSHIAA